MYHHLNSPVFLGACWTEALREGGAGQHRQCMRSPRILHIKKCLPLKCYIHFTCLSYLSCVFVFVCWAASCRLCRHCCLSSCCVPAAHRCQAENSRRSGNSLSTSWDLACLCLDSTVLKRTTIEKNTGLYVCLSFSGCTIFNPQFFSHCLYSFLCGIIRPQICYAVTSLNRILNLRCKHKIEKKKWYRYDHQDGASKLVNKSGSILIDFIMSSDMVL